jgi:AMP-binding enzyme
MPVIERPIPALLRRHAQQQPDAPAFTFVDYELDPAGFTETLTWSQAYRRVRVVAAEVASRGTPGDRVAILAPQGLDYIVGFLAAMEAGRVAVPLSLPTFGTHDERRFCRSPRGGSRGPRRRCCLTTKVVGRACEALQHRRRGGIGQLRRTPGHHVADCRPKDTG